MHMVVHLLVQKSAQNDSIKGKLEEALYVAAECAPEIFRSTVCCKRCEEKDAFDVAGYGPLDGAISNSDLYGSFIFHIVQNKQNS